MTPVDPLGDELRVLIADDEPDVRLLLRLGLRHHDIAVVGEAADGLEVIEACERLEVDAIVLDLLKNPAFRQEKIDLAKTQANTAISRRNDEAGSILVTNQSFFAADSDHWAVLRAWVGDAALPLVEPAW